LRTSRRCLPQKEQWNSSIGSDSYTRTGTRNSLKTSLIGHTLEM
jgi:hypothetical protein